MRFTPFFPVRQLAAKFHFQVVAATTASEADMISNRHPVDRLADIRAEVKELEAEADTIRAGILDGSIGEVGVEYYARIRVTETKRLDKAKVEAAMGHEAMRACMTTSTVTAVTLVAREVE